MSNSLKGKTVAILVADGFEQIEMTSPREALDRAGAKTVLISPESKKVKGWQHTKWGDEFPVDCELEAAQPGDYDALLLPGGVMSPDTLRIHPQALDFIRDIASMGKPIAAICHGPWSLINAKLVRGHEVTSYPSIQMDLLNAGAHWVNEEVVVDRNLLTSRSPEDLPAFNQTMVELFAKQEQLVVEYKD